ncbi:MAG: UDP-N-acetylmuramate--L-alanine ligase [Candidatus Velthaea sp.]
MSLERYHFVGIGGIGMSALARLLLERGAAVSGSDLARSALLEELERAGARVTIGQRAANLADATVVVVSSAIDRGNPEYAAARDRALPILTRGELLAQLTQAHRTVAIAGTHGKTTTTAMTAAIFEAAGFDPTVAVGGERLDTRSNARSGGGAWFITESDESDGSFLHLSPAIAVVTNIENDHVVSDEELPRLSAQFAAFLQSVPPDGHAVVGTDSPASARLAEVAGCATTTFATRVAADLRATGIRYAALGSRSTVELRGARLGELALPVPGEINVQNALAALAAALAAGIAFAGAARTLSTFAGVRRRFEIVGRGASLTIVDDYAHHPTAVAQTIAAARAAHDGPILVAFQPHRYSRTAYLADSFARALAAADRVVLAPVYAASEAPVAGVSERSIGELLSKGGTPVDYVARVEDLVEWIPAFAPPNALVLMLGAGSISSVARAMSERLGLPGALARG